MSPVARVALRKNLARAVRSGHPWIYRDALRPVPALPDGALVLVTTGDGRPLGRGFWTATTPIAVRMLTTDPAEQIASLIPARLEAALRGRLAFLDLGQTNAFRWVHGEADLLPGLHLDVYGRAASIRFDGNGARAFFRDVAAAECPARRVPSARADPRR
jgi:23S rRNA (cytosine1962-C5)-methyltransferase